MLSWMRTPAFQLQMLCQIAEQALLLGAPAYRGLTSLPLSVPGAMPSGPWRLRTHVTLFVSDDNPGAREVAHKLCACIKGLRITRTLPGDDENRWTLRGRFSLRKRTVHASRSSRLSATARSAHDRLCQLQSSCSVAASSAWSAAPSPARSSGPRVMQRCTTTDPPSSFLLVLNASTFTCTELSYGEPERSRGEALADQVRQLRAMKLPMVLVHVIDEEQGGVSHFSHFFGCTPPDLLMDGLYKQIATPWYSVAAYRGTSIALIAKALGASVVPAKPMPKGKRKPAQHTTMGDVQLPSLARNLATPSSSAPSPPTEAPAPAAERPVTATEEAPMEAHTLAAA